MKNPESKSSRHARVGNNPLLLANKASPSNASEMKVLYSPSGAANDGPEIIIENPTDENAPEIPPRRSRNRPRHGMLYSIQEEEDAANSRVSVMSGHLAAPPAGRRETYQNDDPRRRVSSMFTRFGPPPRRRGTRDSYASYYHSNGHPLSYRQSAFSQMFELSQGGEFVSIEVSEEKKSVHV